jgi:hypothetical protein
VVKHVVAPGGGVRCGQRSGADEHGWDQEEAREVAVVAYGGSGALTRPAVARIQKLPRRRPWWPAAERTG